MLVSEIADLLGYEIAGDDCNVSGIAWFGFATEDDIAVIREREDLNRTKAKVILTKPIFLQTDKTLLITYDDVDYSIVKLCEVFIKKGVLHDYRIPIKYTQNDSGFYVGNDCLISENAVIQLSGLALCLERELGLVREVKSEYLAFIITTLMNK